MFTKPSPALVSLTSCLSERHEKPASDFSGRAKVSQFGVELVCLGQCFETLLSDRPYLGLTDKRYIPVDRNKLQAEQCIKVLSSNLMTGLQNT